MDKIYKIIIIIFASSLIFGQSISADGDKIILCLEHNNSLDIANSIDQETLDYIISQCREEIAENDIKCIHKYPSVFLVCTFPPINYCFPVIVDTKIKKDSQVAQHKIKITNTEQLFDPNSELNIDERFNGFLSCSEPIKIICYAEAKEIIKDESLWQEINDVKNTKGQSMLHRLEPLLASVLDGYDALIDLYEFAIQQDKLTSLTPAYVETYAAHFSKYPQAIEGLKKLLDSDWASAKAEDYSKRHFLETIERMEQKLKKEEQL